MRRPIISAMIDDGTTQLVFDRCLPGSELVEEPEQADLADRTQVQYFLYRTLTLRLLLDEAQRAQLAAWVGARTKVAFTGETLTEVLYWQDLQLVVTDGAESGAPTMTVTAKQASLY